MPLHRREAMAWCECEPFSILQPISCLLAETQAGSGGCMLPQRRWWRRWGFFVLYSLAWHWHSRQVCVMLKLPPMGSLKLWLP